jgi:hypothetical protein
LVDKGAFHAATPSENERKRKATCPAATVIRTRPVSFWPAHQEFADRLS